MSSTNPTAKIIVTADVLAQVEVLLAAGADYISLPRLHEAGDLLEAVRAATEGLLETKREKLKSALATRREVLG